MAVILEELLARLRAVARPEESPEALLVEAVQEFIARREQEAARWEAARAEAQAILDGPRRPWSEAEAAFRSRHDLPDFSHLTREEREAAAERVLTAMDPAARAALQREGLL